MIRSTNQVDDFELLSHLDKCEPRLKSYLASHIPSSLLSQFSADDILQETWASAFRDLPKFVPDGPDALDRWLTSIANHRLLDAIKAARRAKRGGANQPRNVGAFNFKSSIANLLDAVASDGRTPSAEFALGEAVQVVISTLETLPLQRRRAVRMRYLEGRSIAEIGQSLAKSKPAVHSLLFHGLRQLRERMGSAERFFSDAKSEDRLQG